ncbi:conserved phage C-terminal domain-containing protein [Riemerella anatipestifer]|uniref:conserved phage C-terminal domain-containing protein n=1 Tax=Riemerella anatipestifer TaxID=34085 RepID=UPI0007EDB0DC|nr:conserved phage C-terminal domain-containing protein [Riemerella anatipestifer]MDR7817100.1 conserved phage C-terminal domain-containing protein [Riemerella anatipestifer]MDR7849667.1 conserved phage C-terminal domain-containing protein [Riemerella anatipestifer]MDR7880337.1 conserved phage C-terminal domain-containing protein [Riemerella anatipestifer]MDY3501724.1 conserved phage C-terminal domain-containing protein [Riemerella anatipestifer]MDY3528684.1 conserved phage C-terminal domain-c
MKAEILTMEKELLKKFNEITGRRFRETKANLQGISARLKDGYTEQEILEVIQLKTLEWKKNPTMSVHLNPVTIFRPSNFDKYINQVLTIKENPQQYAKYFQKINRITNGASAADNDDAISELYG